MQVTWASLLTALPIVISVLSLILSLINLLLTHRQKMRQDRLTARKSLTDAISSIVTANTEMTKLFSQPATEYSVGMRRNINSHRRNVADHADLLLSEVPQFATDADHYIVASAYDNFGDFDRADHHWKRAVQLARTPITTCIARRGYGRFLFPWGHVERAREMFAEAVRPLTATDDRNRRERADTYALWAMTERDAGYLDEALQYRAKAIIEAKNIQSKSSRENMLEYVESLWQPEIKTIAVVTNEVQKHPG